MAAATYSSYNLPHQDSYSSHHSQCTHCNHFDYLIPETTRTRNSMFGSLKRKLTNKKSPTSSVAYLPTSPLPAQSNDAPPAYTAHLSPASPSSATPISDAPQPSSYNRPTSTPTQDDPYAFLSTFDTLFLIDDSSSMRGSRWQQCGAAVSAIAPICTSHDEDGIDIAFLNTPPAPHHSNIRSAAAVSSIFSSVTPSGGTPTGQCLDAILRAYLKRYEKSLRQRANSASPPPTRGFKLSSALVRKQSAEEVKPLNIIVITDGAPTDDVESPLIAAARKLDALEAPAWQVGVQFFQVGDDDTAAAHLRDLDDGLAELAGESIRDFVDTVPFVPQTVGRGWERGRYGETKTLSAEGILKVVLGAVNRRLDRREVVHT